MQRQDLSEQRRPRPTLSRRCFGEGALALCVGTAVCLPTASSAHRGAHDGLPGAGSVVVELERMDRLGAQLVLRLLVENTTNSSITLYGATGDAGDVVLALGQTVLGRGASETMVAQVNVTGQVPALLSVLLNFGADGFGPVLEVTSR